jgi:hypothetical protein
MLSFLLWCILFVMCWPLALLLPFRLVGIAVQGVLELVKALVLLSSRLLSAPFRI